MDDEAPTSCPRRWRRLALAAVALPGFALVAAGVVDLVHVQRLRAGLRSPSADARAGALRVIAHERQVRLAGTVAEVIAAEQDREVLDMATRAAARVRDRVSVEPLLRRAAEGPDDPLRAQMIASAAFLADRDVRLIDPLEAGITSSEPWRQAGSAVGLAVLGRPEAGAYLVELAPDLPPEARAYVTREFARITEPMAQAVGRRLDWSGADDGEFTDVQWAEVRAFWQQHATLSLLNDVLDRIEQRDPKWFQVNRLLHARERFAAWFKSGGDPDASEP